MRFSHNFTPNHFGAYIFVGSPGSKPEHGQHLQQPEKTDHDSVLWKCTLFVRVSCTLPRRTGCRSGSLWSCLRWFLLRNVLFSDLSYLLSGFEYFFYLVHFVV